MLNVSALGQPFKIQLRKDEKLLKESSDAHECLFMLPFYYICMSYL